MSALRALRSPEYDILQNMSIFRTCFILHTERSPKDAKSGLTYEKHSHNMQKNGHARNDAAQNCLSHACHALEDELLLAVDPAVYSLRIRRPRSHEGPRATHR